MDQITEKKRIAYIAGIIDGEGCITISKHIDKRKKGHSYQSHIIIVQKDKSLLEYINNFYYSNIKTMGKYFKWALHKQDSVTQFLKDILPYLLIKREQSKLVLEYLESRKNGEKKYNQNEVQIYEKVKLLKKQYPSELQTYNFTDDEKLDYVAGLIDGEGSVRITKAIHKNKIIMTPQITIANTDKRLMEFLKKEFGGFYYEKKRELPKRNLYQWFMQGLKEEFFNKLNGRLILKQKQLDCILDYIKSRKINTTRENEIEIFLRIRALNKKGKELYNYEQLKKYTIRKFPPQRKMFITNEELRRLYWKEGLSIREIARKFGVKYSSVHGRMIRRNIERRPSIIKSIA